MQMSKEIKKYLKEIKLLLPAFSKEEKKFLRDLTERIEDYLDENPNATMQDIENQFGTLWKLRKAICPLWIWMYCLSVCPSAVSSVDFLRLLQSA